MAEQVDLKHLPLSQIKEDENQPRKEFGTSKEENRLLSAIKLRGMLDPITVLKTGKDEYIIVDGHRRYQCAQHLKWTLIWAVIWPTIESDADFEIWRYDLQNNRRWWRPSERADSMYRIRQGKDFTSDQDVADTIGVSRSLVSNSLSLHDDSVAYNKLMKKHDISQSYCDEFMKMSGKIRDVRDKNVNAIVLIIIEKIKTKVIKNAKDIRTLGKIFIRAGANEKQLYRFLTDSDMTIEQLKSESSLTDIAETAEEMMKKVASVNRDGMDLSDADVAALNRLEEFLKKRHPANQP